jgi:hypothetical protein
MPNLENIHNSFFQRARVGSWGKKLIVLAWVIEIMIAGVSLAIAYVFNFTSLLAEPGADTYVIVLALIAVAVMELTKVPVSIALYYSQRWLWRSLFLFLLVAANYSTFETMIQAFDLSYYTRLQPVDNARENLENIREEIGLQKSKLNTDSLDLNLENLNKQYEDAIKAKTVIEEEKNLELARLKDEYSVDNSILNSIKESIENKKNERDTEKKLLAEAIKNKGDIQGGFFKSRDIKKSLENDIAQYQENIQKYDNDINKLENDYKTSLRKTSGKDEAKAKLIEEKYKIRLIPVEDSINKLNQSINFITNRVKSVREQTDTIETSIKKQEELLVEQEKEAKKIMQANPIYRISLRIKNRPEWLGGKGGNFKITDVNQDDLDFAFTIWFGGLAFVISVIGTGVALAGLHLQDERLHLNNEKPFLKNFFRNIYKIPLLINSYIWNGIKWLWKPKTRTIRERIEVPVEKIVEKPVVEEKIIYQKVEVPKEIERKIFVHVPFPTDDPEVIKKGPMIYNDKDIDKNKKK